MVTREMQERLEVLTRGFPVITITGPRQSGKTTLARMAYPDHVYMISRAWSRVKGQRKIRLPCLETAGVVTFWMSFNMCRSCCRM